MEKLAEGFLLSFFQKIEIVHQGVQVLQVAEEGIGLHQILVGIVEIADEELSPEIEVVQGFLALGYFLVYPVEVADQFDGISGLQGGSLTEQVADAEVDGRPDGMFGFTYQYSLKNRLARLLGKTTATWAKSPPSL